MYTQQCSVLSAARVKYEQTRRQNNAAFHECSPLLAKHKYTL